MYNPQFETFISVAECGSFSKAAEALYITPTATMKQINSLERRLGITLFSRTNHGLVLTKAGLSFLEDAKYILDYSVRSIEKARDIDARETQKTIRIGTSIMTPTKFLLDIWPKIQEHDPSMKIELIPFDNTPENAREILSNLGKHIDMVAGIYDEWLLNASGCQAAHLDDKHISLAVPLTHPLADKEIISAEAIRGHSVMLVRNGWSEYVNALRGDLVASDVRIMDFDFFNINVFNQAVTENIPIMTIDGWENIHPLLRIIPTEWKHTIPFGIMYSREPSTQVKNFIEVVQKITK